MAKPKLPRDANHNLVPLVPDTPAIARTATSSISSSTTVNLNANTSIIEVNALAQGIYLKYTNQTSPVAVTSANYDEYIQAGGVRHYVIPASINAITVLEQASAATMILIEK